MVETQIFQIQIWKESGKRSDWITKLYGTKANFENYVISINLNIETSKLEDYHTLAHLIMLIHIPYSTCIQDCWSYFSLSQVRSVQLCYKNWWKASECWIIMCLIMTGRQFNLKGFLPRWFHQITKIKIIVFKKIDYAID